jgi:hypothetical protein
MRCDPYFYLDPRYEAQDLYKQAVKEALDGHALSDIHEDSPVRALLLTGKHMAVRLGDLLGLGVILEKNGFDDKIFATIQAIVLFYSLAIPSVPDYAKYKTDSTIMANRFDALYSPVEQFIESALGIGYDTVKNNVPMTVLGNQLTHVPRAKPSIHTKLGIFQRVTPVVKGIVSFIKRYDYLCNV